MILQIVLLYASFAVVDLFDKFLISKRKIQPLSYDFFTLVTGALVLVIWPWVYSPLLEKFIWLNLLSGAYYGLAMYVYFKVLSMGEVSRVVPVIFGLVPLFDILFSVIFHHKSLLPQELAALALLVPGALMLAYYPGRKFFGHFGLKVLAAFLISSYNWLWQYGAQIGGGLNNLMWNRLGAAAVMVLLLIIPLARKNVFKSEHVPKKAHTGFLFLAKQGLGGLNFIILSLLLATGKVPIVDGLSGFRYVFLFGLTLILGYRFRHILDEPVDRETVKLKLAGLALVFLGTVVLFLGNQ